MLNRIQVAPSIDVLFSSPTSLYAIGPVDPAQITLLHAHLSTGEEYSLLIPVQLPSCMLTHATFKQGCECGYTEGNPEEEMWTVPKLVNEVYHILSDLCYEDEPDIGPWTLGFLLGILASLAEQDQTLALTGLAHSCALLSFFPLGGVIPCPLHCLLRARGLHNRALYAYRARVRVYREQGANFSEAQRLALATPAQSEGARRQEGQQHAVS